MLLLSVARRLQFSAGASTRSVHTPNRNNTASRMSQCSFADKAHQPVQFKGQGDRYNGVTVNSTKEPCDVSTFPARLEASMKQWVKDKKRTIWFQVDLAQAYWVPDLTSRGFRFHHAKEEYVTMYRWLPEDETSNIPPYAHTNLGIGGLVLNEKTNEILVIKEKLGKSEKNTHWKLPGGYIEPGEELSKAVEREVLEETGITAKFKCLVAFRHAHGYAFDCSDIYAIACLVPITFDINKCSREVLDCRWMNIEEFVKHPNVHGNNRLLASKALDFLEHRMGIVADCVLHPLSKKMVNVYSISNIKDSA